MALGADVIFLGLDVVAAGDIIKAVKVAKVANTEAKAANNVMDEYVATPENAGMPNAVKRESRDNLYYLIDQTMGRNTKGNVSIESAAYIVFDSSSVWCNWLFEFSELYAYIIL